MTAAENESSRICSACGDANPSISRFCNNCGAKLPEAEAAAPADPLIGKTILDRYRITGEIGEGGMGKVYMAAQKMGNATRNVAIKTLHPELSNDPQIVARFRRESETVIQLTHPNTIQFYDFGELSDGTLFIVMEFIKGDSLARVLESGPLSPPRVDKILVQVCGSLSEAHEIGVVHRDLKPDNILLTNRGGQTDFVKVLDFGIAKRSEAEDAKSTRLTKQGMVLGTPPYMSPEQFSGVALDARSDIYSLGLITYEMLTGKLPFSANSPWEWATQHLTATPTPLTEHPQAANLPPQKVAAVMRALSRNRDDRQPTVLDFMREFTGLADAQAAWTMMTTPGGTPSNKPAVNPYTPTGIAVSPLATGSAARTPLGTPEPMPETGEIEAQLLGARTSQGWTAGKIMKVSVALGILLGLGIGGYSLVMAPPKTDETAAAQGAAPPTNPATPPAEPAQNGIPSTPPHAADPAEKPTADKPEVDARDPKADDRGTKKPRTGPSSGGTTGQGSGTGSVTGSGSTTPTTPDPEPTKPGTTTGNAGGTTTTTPPTDPTTPSGTLTLPPGTIGGGGTTTHTRPTSAGVLVVAPTQINAPKDPPAPTPPPTSGKSTATLEREGLSALNRRDFSTALANLKQIRKQDPGGGQGLANQLARMAPTGIREMVSSNCAGAQKLYKDLLSAGVAIRSAERYFNTGCRVPR